MVRLVTMGQATIDDVVTAEGHTYLSTAGGNALYAALGAALWLGDGVVGPVYRIGKEFPIGARHTLGRRLNLKGIRRIHGEHVRAWLLYEPDGRRRRLGRNPILVDHPPTTASTFVRYMRHYRSLMRSLTPTASDIPRSFATAHAIHLAPQFASGTCRMPKGPGVGSRSSASTLHLKTWRSLCCACCCAMWTSSCRVVRRFRRGIKYGCRPAR